MASRSGGLEGSEEDTPAQAALPPKLIAPQAADAIPRARLFRALDRLRAPVTWIQAPAGAGKTTLVASYLAERGAPSLWYDVDAGDADPNALFHYLGLAAQRLAGRSLSLPTPLSDSPDAQRAFAARYFQALFAALPEGTILVFDDYQDAIEHAGWNETFGALCAATPQSARVIALSRVSAPVSLARLSGRGELDVLDFRELRFDEPEIRRVLKREPRASLDSAELLALTDGWAVAVTLLSRSGTARKATDASEPVFRFLAGEILERLDDASREVLLRVSPMPSFTEAMASALTGRSDAPSVLVSLCTEQLLVERHGETGFRIHDLFRAFLQDRARAALGDREWSDLCARAARLLAADDQFPAAVDLLAATGEAAALGDLIEQRAPTLASQARIATLASALERIPEEHRRSRPWLLYWEAVAALGRPSGGASELAERAFEAFRARDDVAGTLLAWALVVQALVIGADDFRRIAEWLDTLERLALTPPSPQIAVRVASSEVLAYAFWNTGSPKSLEAAERALEIVGRYGSAEDRVHVGGGALLVFCIGARLERAEDMCRLARDRFEQAGDNPFPKLAYLHSEALFEMTRANFREASRAVEEGLTLARSSGIQGWNGSLIIVGVLCALARRDHSTAQRLLDAMSVGAAAGPRMARGQYAYGRGWLALARGDLELAERWLIDCNRETKRLGFSFGFTQNALADLALACAQGNAAGIESVLAELDGYVAGASSPWIAGTAALARVYARTRVGQEAVDELRSAMAEVRRLGGNPWFLGHEVIAHLATLALEHGIEPELAARLLRAYEVRPGPEALAMPAWPWPLRIRTLGRLDIEIDGRALQFGRKTPVVPLRLLHLLSSATEPLPIKAVANTLWPEDDASAPRGALDTALYRLRKLLENDAAIESSHGRLALAPDLVWTDVRAFAGSCDRIAALAAERETAPRDAVERCERSLIELYRGPFAEGDDAPPIERTRARLRRRFARAVAELQRVWASLGEPARGRALLQTALAREPLLDAELG